MRRFALAAAAAAICVRAAGRVLRAHAVDADPGHVAVQRAIHQQLEQRPARLAGVRRNINSKHDEPEQQRDRE